MKRAWLLVLWCAGCKSSPAKPEAPMPASDAAIDAAIDAAPDAFVWDAPPLVPPAGCGSGTTIHARALAGRADDGAMLATSPPGDPRLFVVERRGQVRLFKNENKIVTPFLDLTGTDKVLAGNEQGLLGLAFHPKYQSNRTFYVYYTGPNPAVSANPHFPYLDIVERYTASATDPDVADPSSGTVILAVPDPYANHNGGMIEFGNDGYLYVSIGDGGSGGDPDRNGQNKNVLLGKILRLDVDHPANGKPYGIPADNPFATSGGAPEIWVLGVRNPWRWSFDRATGDMWIADVGEARIEELDVLPAGQQAGKNLGWSAYEGSTCCANDIPGLCGHQDAPLQACDPSDKVMPVLERLHADGYKAIVGGQVYRGTCYPSMVGWYFFSDYVAGGLSKARLKADGTLEVVDLPPQPPLNAWPTSPAAIHADARGELFITTLGGLVWTIEAH